MKKLLITGASGFLGRYLCREAVPKWRVYGICNSHAVYADNVTVLKTDLTDYAAVKAVFGEILPDAVIHAAAVSQPNECERYPSETRKINTDVPADLAGICSDLQIPFVFTSSDLVFDGLNPPYSENSEINPVCVYGEQKADAEKAVLKRWPRAAVCRMPLMFGYTEGTRENFYQQTARSLVRGERIAVFSDEYRTPADAESASKGLLLAAERVTGTLHLGGRTRISRYEMGKMLSKLLGVSESLLKPVLQKDIPMPARRPPDVSLDSSNGYAIGYDPLDIESACRRILENMGIFSRPSRFCQFYSF